MAAEQLLNVLSLYGFEQSQEVAPALRAACENEASCELVRWLADKFRPDCLATRREYSPSEQEQKVASSFEASLKAPSSEVLIDPELVAKRNATAAVLYEAKQQLLSEVEQAAELQARGRMRLENKIATLEGQVTDGVGQLTKTLAEIGASADELSAIVSSECNGQKLLCFQSVEEYRALDAKVMKALEGLCAEQFEFAEGPDEERDTGIERLLRGESEAAVASRAQEVERLRLAFQQGLIGKVRMAALQAKQEKSLHALQGALTRPELGSQDTAMLKAEVEKQQASLDRLIARKHQILEEELPQVAKSIASVHCWDVIKADFDVELQRNKYYGAKKEVVLDVLTNRAARAAALFAAAMWEGEALCKSQDCLQATAEELGAVNFAAQRRLAKCAALDSMPPREPSIIQSPVKMPPKDLAEERESTFAKLMGTVMGDATPKLQETSGILHALAFRDQALEGPCLTLEPLAESLKSVERVYKSLVEANEAVYRQQEEYNGVMRLQREQVGIERSVFPGFFSCPEQLPKLAGEVGQKPSSRERAAKPKPSPPKTSARKPRSLR